MNLEITTYTYRNGWIFIPEELNIDRHYAFVRLSCEKNRILVHRSNSSEPERNTFCVRVNVSDQRIRVPKPIRNAYDFKPQNPVQKKSNGDYILKVKCKSVPQARPVHTPPVFSPVVKKDSLKVVRPQKAKFGYKINVKKSGLCRVDVYTNGSHKIWIRDYDPVRDNGLNDVSGLFEDYGPGFAQMPPQEFSYLTNIADPSEFMLYSGVAKMWDLSSSVKFKVYETVDGDVVVVPEDINCDICGEPIDMIDKVPTKLNFDRDIANDDVLKTLINKVDGLNSLIYDLSNKCKTLANDRNSERRQRQRLERELKAYQDAVGDLSVIPQAKERKIGAKIDEDEFIVICKLRKSGEISKKDAVRLSHLSQPTFDKYAKKYGF